MESKQWNLLLAYIKTFLYGEAGAVYAEWHPENIVSEKLFRSYGFEIIAQEEDDVVVAKRSLFA